MTQVSEQAFSDLVPLLPVNETPGDDLEDIPELDFDSDEAGAFAYPAHHLAADEGETAKVVKEGFDEKEFMNQVIRLVI